MHSHRTTTPIRPGALGLGLPERDLMVNPQHRMLVRSNVARNMFGAREGLVAAKQLLGLDGIEVAGVDEVTYVHFLCAAHEIVFAEGAPYGSLYTGAEALKSVGPAARREIFTLFPELQNRAPDDLPHSGRPLIKAPPAAGWRIAWSRTKSGRLSCQ